MWEKVRSCFRKLKNYVWRDAFWGKRDGYVTWILFPCISDNDTTLLKDWGGGRGEREKSWKGKKFRRLLYWHFYGEVFSPRRMEKRGDSGEIGTRRTFWLYCWRQELFLSKDNIRHYHLQNRCHVKAFQVQKGQERDVVTSSHPSEVCLVV